MHARVQNFAILHAARETNKIENTFTVTFIGKNNGHFTIREFVAKAFSQPTKTDCWTTKLWNSTKNLATR